ncbi:MAG: mandelate racemase/muconate lactonizing enzyme family protein [Acidobacteria bacterium]|nr:mandelate racemase/muconate lactonizing enzyme family protein [Acidobacteriota bacterium]
MRIRSVEARPIRLPRDITAATGRAGSPTQLAAGASRYRWSQVFPCLYSTDFETALVRITTTEGRVGWGEAQAPLAPEVACTIVERLLAPVLEDQEFEGSPESIAVWWDRLYSTMRVRGQTGGFMLDAISAVDTALWDLAGQAAGKPVCEMIAPKPKRSIPAYYSGLPANGRAEAARAAGDRGFTQFKLFYDTPEPEAFLGSMDALPPASYAVDALWRHTPEEAARFGAELDARQALWFEAPLAPEDAVAHGQLARLVRTPIAIGESYRTRFEMAAFFRERAVEVLQPDLGRCGITEGLRLAAMAAEAGIPVVPHLSIAFGPQIAAALQFAAATENCRLAEYNEAVLETANRFLERPIEILDAAYQVPDEPGLGIRLAEAL